MATAAQHAPGNAASFLRIYIECHNLLDKDALSKSDPFCCLRMKNADQPAFQEIGRTEVQMNNLSPKFTKTFDIVWHFEIRQDIEIHVYDWDSGDAKTCDVNKQDFLGCAKTQISSIVGSAGMQLLLPIEYKGRPLPRSKMILRAEKLQDPGSATFNLQLKMKGKSLAKKDWFGKSDPYVQFCRLRPDGAFDVVFTTEVVKNTLDPAWKPFSLKSSQLASSLDSNFRINVIDWDSVGSHDPIGHIITTPKRFVEAIQAKEALKLTHYKGRVKYVGELVFDGSTAVAIPRFIDYLSGGLQMRLFVAVDFTASNGPPADPRSLHHKRPGFFNEYQTAIATVGDILQSYDSSKQFACYGFGGLVSTGRSPPATSHCFALNGFPAAPCVNGVQGVLDAYEKALMNVGLSGPTNFAPVITAVTLAAHDLHRGFASGRQHYGVLLILTDGQITDMSETMNAIARAALLPLSIIIVGVGTDSFENMHILDGDERPYAARDIVQLTAEVLAEVPDQVVRYMTDNNIAPRSPLPPPTLSAASFAASSAPPLTPTSVTPTSAASVPAASFASFVPPPPPPAQALPPLPPGWSEVMDTVSQRPYYARAPAHRELQVASNACVG